MQPYEVMSQPAIFPLYSCCVNFINNMVGIINKI